MRRVLAPALVQSCSVIWSTASVTRVIAVTDTTAQRRILTFGETSIDWAAQNEKEKGLQIDMVMKNRTSDNLVREKATASVESSARMLALQDIANGFERTVLSTRTETSDLLWFEEAVDLCDVDEDARAESICGVSNLSPVHEHDKSNGLDAVSFLGVLMDGVEYE